MCDINTLYFEWFQLLSIVRVGILLVVYGRYVSEKMYAVAVSNMHYFWLIFIQCGNMNVSIFSVGIDVLSGPIMMFLLKYFAIQGAGESSKNCTFTEQILISIKRMEIPS